MKLLHLFDVLRLKSQLLILKLEVEHRIASLGPFQRELCSQQGITPQSVFVLCLLFEAHDDCSRPAVFPNNEKVRNR